MDHPVRLSLFIVFIVGVGFRDDWILIFISCLHMKFSFKLVAIGQEILFQMQLTINKN